MRVIPSVVAAIVAAAVPAAVLADDPHDASMRSAVARARDREAIRQLNLRELAMVRERDAGYAQGWRTARVGGAAYAGRSPDHERAVADYDRQREQYERKMADWRRAVSACRAGDYSACEE